MIKIDISPQEIKSSSFRLNALIGVDRKLIGNDQIEFSINFQTGSFGLRYSQDLKHITDFFQHKTVERLVRVEMKCNNADSFNERLIRLETQMKSK